jgi:hypothetical protein
VPKSRAEVQNKNQGTYTAGYSVDCQLLKLIILLKIPRPTKVLDSLMRKNLYILLWQLIVPTRPNQLIKFAAVLAVPVNVKVPATVMESAHQVEQSIKEVLVVPVAMTKHWSRYCRQQTLAGQSNCTQRWS